MATDKEVFDFMSDFNNFSSLMPPQVKNWQSTADTCSFTIEGMTDLAMRIHKREANSLVEMISDGKAPFEFVLSCHFLPQGEGQSQAYLVFHADLNPFLTMVAVKPLTNFVNLLIQKLQEHFA